MYWGPERSERIVWQKVMWPTRQCVATSVNDVSSASLQVPPHYTAFLRNS